MFRKLSVFILLTTLAGTAAFGQKKGAVTTTGKGESAGAGASRVFAYSFGDGPYIGVQIDEVNKENMAKYGLREVRGVGIEKVIENSPAAAAGLQNNDVIIKFNGEDVTSERKLVRLLAEVAPDHQATLKIIRNGDEREVTVTVGKHPGLKFDNGAWATTVPGRIGKLEMPDMKEWKAGDTPRAFAWGGTGRYIGASLISLTKQLGEHFGVADGKGMLVTDVKEGSPAARAGIKAGDIIVEIDGKEVSPENNIFRVLRDKKEGDITLTVVRDRNRQTFTVTPEERKGDAVGAFHFEPGDLAITTPMLAPGAIAPLKLMVAPMPVMPQMPEMPAIAPMPQMPAIAPLPVMPFFPGRVI
jgi:C-terminal processing protease CtpA/Prc